MSVTKLANENPMEISIRTEAMGFLLLQNSTTEGYPLYYAIWKKAHASVIEALLMKGADPNKRDLSFSESPLKCFCSIQNGMYEKVKLLVEYGADVNSTGLFLISVSYFKNFDEESKEILIDIQNNKGKTAYDIAVELGYGEYVQGLIPNIK